MRANPLRFTDPSGHLTIFQPPSQELIKQEMEIRWQQYQSADSAEAKAGALEKYRYWQGQLSERQDNEIFAEEVTTPMAVAAWTSAAAGPIAAEFAALKVALAGMGVVGGSSEIREGAKQGGQLGTARVIAGVATVLASVAAVVPEGIRAVKWLKGRISGEKPAVTTVVESWTSPGTTPVPEAPPGEAPKPRFRSLGAAAAGDPALEAGDASLGTKTSQDLYAFGNKAGPRAPRPVQDFGVEGPTSKIGPEAPPTPKGASTFGDPSQARLTGHYHRLPAGTELPEGFGVVADGPEVMPDSPHPLTHSTLFPTVETTVEGFEALFKNLPWEYGGKK